MASSKSRCRLFMLLCGVVSVLLLHPLLVHGMCPRECRCFRDFNGRKQVVCDQGGMEDSLPIPLMENDIWKLVVTAPPSNLNKLVLSRTFYKFKKLNEIHITNSLLPAIGDGTFKGLLELQKLNLTNNNITQILESNFQNLTSLQSLHLDNNNIQHMPSAAFHNLPNLLHLTMSRNKITQLVPRLFLKLTKLEELNLNSNPLEVNVDPDVFKDVRQLRILQLSDCQQTQFNSMSLRYLPNLEHLDLSYNRLQYFTIEESHYVTKLKVLYLHGNRIPSIFNGTFAGLNLQKLTLASNHLQYLQMESFSNVTIVDLDLAYNQLQISDPDLLTHLANRLEVLHIGGNRLSQHTLSKMLTTLPYLRTLDIAGLNLKEINPDVLHLPSSLKRLNMSGNGLTKFPVRTLALLKHVEMLDLSRNQFRGLDSDLIDQLDSMLRLRHLRLHGNPWSCDLCYIPALMVWLNNSRYFDRACLPRDLESRQCLRCVTPPELVGRAIQLLDDAMLGGCDGLGAEQSASFHQGHIGLVVASVILLLLLITVVVVLVMYYRRGADYYTHEEDREEDGIYENPGVDDEKGDLLNDKKTTKVAMPPSPGTTLPDGNGHAAQTKPYHNSSGNAHPNASNDNGRIEHY